MIAKMIAKARKNFAKESLHKILRNDFVADF